MATKTISKVKIKNSDGVLEEYNIGSMSGLLDFFYPVGCYFETSNEAFNPNTAWGGTWVQDTQGQVLVSKDTSTFKTVGSNVGANTKTITQANMPSHDHSLNNHTHQYYVAATTTGTASGNTGPTALTIDQIPSHRHTTYGVRKWKDGGDYAWITNGPANYATEEAVSEATGGGKEHVHTLNNHSHSIDNNSRLATSASPSVKYTAKRGDGVAFDVTQNSKVVIRWHRTA